jgi:hypothetical protein
MNCHESTADLYHDGLEQLQQFCTNCSGYLARFGWLLCTEDVEWHNVIDNEIPIGVSVSEKSV